LATGQRREEVTSAKWFEFDIENGVWTIPSYRTKSNRGDHLVPLSSLALELLSSIPHMNDDYEHIFVSGRAGDKPFSGYGKAKKRLDEASSVSEWRLHDLRRTVGTIMEEELHIAPHIIGAVLNHDPKFYKGITATYTVGGIVEDQRKALVAWGDKLVSIIENQQTTNVVSISGE